MGTKRDRTSAIGSQARTGARGASSALRWGRPFVRPILRRRPHWLAKVFVFDCQALIGTRLNKHWREARPGLAQICWQILA